MSIIEHLKEIEEYFNDFDEFDTAEEGWDLDYLPAYLEGANTLLVFSRDIITQLNKDNFLLSMEHSELEVENRELKEELKEEENAYLELQQGLYKAEERIQELEEEVAFYKQKSLNLEQEILNGNI